MQNGDVVSRVGCDMACPHDGGAGGRETRHQAERLRIVNDDEIVRPHDTEGLGELSAQRVVVVAALCLTEGPTVTQVSVQAVVDTLRDLEEPGVRVEHESQLASIPSPGRYRGSC